MPRRAVATRRRQERVAIRRTVEVPLVGVVVRRWVDGAAGKVPVNCMGCANSQTGTSSRRARGWTSNHSRPVPMSSSRCELSSRASAFAVRKVEAGGEQQTGRERADEGQHPDGAQRPPGREQESDGQREAPRSRFVRDVDGRALVGAVEQNRELPSPSCATATATSARRTGIVSSWACRWSSARNRCGGRAGRVDPHEADWLAQRCRFGLEFPAGAAAAKVSVDLGPRDAGVLAVDPMPRWLREFECSPCS